MSSGSRRGLAGARDELCERHVVSLLVRDHLAQHRTRGATELAARDRLRLEVRGEQLGADEEPQVCDVALGSGGGRHAGERSWNQERTARNAGSA